MPDTGGARVKICGLTTAPDIAAAIDGGAAYIGFVFFDRSPRFIAPAEAATLAQAVPPGVCKVALTVDASDAELDAMTAQTPLDMLQLHGSEPPARVAEVKARYGLPVMKAIGIATAADLPEIDAFTGVADQILVDAKPPAGAEVPGGNGLQFDWRLLAGRRWPVPWMLAGGLTAETVADAIARTGARQVDVSSGVERSRGVKDPARIRAFLATAVARPAAETV